MLYDPVLAKNTTKGNADHFSHLVYDLLKEYNRTENRHGLLMVAFDTELFGHWWFEGVHWIKEVLERLAQSETVELCTASGYPTSSPATRARLPVGGS